MGKSKPPLCFVDDGPDEIRRFKSTFGDRFTIGAGQTLDDALRDLRSQGEDEPSLCVLDMYFPRKSDPKMRLTLARFEMEDSNLRIACGND